MIPIGILLRKRSREQEQARDDVSNSKVKLTKIDDIIAQLEQAAESENDSDSDSASASETDDEIDESNIDSAIIEERNELGQVVKLVSTNINDTIAPLPVHMLPIPLPKSKTAREKKVASSSGEKVVKFSDEPSAVPSDKRSKDKKSLTQSAEPKDQVQPQSGLETTIREMLKSYQPSSADRRPFWCRICRFQGENLDDWTDHKSTEGHKMAEKMERKMSACRVCRKEFTSPDQLKEHMKGNPHKLAMENAKARQELARKFR